MSLHPRQAAASSSKTSARVSCVHRVVRSGTAGGSMPIGPGQQPERVPREVEVASAVVLHVAERTDAEHRARRVDGVVRAGEHRHPIAVLRVRYPVDGPTDSSTAGRPSHRAFTTRVEGPVRVRLPCTRTTGRCSSPAAAPRSTRAPSPSRSRLALQCVDERVRDRRGVDRTFRHPEAGDGHDGSARASSSGRPRRCDAHRDTSTRYRSARGSARDESRRRSSK